MVAHQMGSALFGYIAILIYLCCEIKEERVWKRRCADVRAGTQAPPLRFRLGRLCVGGWRRLGGLCVGRLMSFGWIARGWLISFGGLRVGGFVCLENGTHEPTPSVLYFCQPRVD